MTQEEIDFLLKICGHDLPNGYRESGMIDYLRMIERSLYETIEFVENFNKRKNIND